MHFNVNHPSQCNVKACVVPPSSSHTIQSSVHVHRKCRVGFMFTRSAEYGSCSQEVQSRSVHIHDQYGVVFMFTKSMEHTISVHEQKQCVVQFMFTNRTAQICLQEAVQSSVHVHSFSAGQRQNYQRFQNTIATFLCFKNAFILAFPQMCVHQFNDKIWYGRSLDLIG